MKKISILAALAQRISLALQVVYQAISPRSPVFIGIALMILAGAGKLEGVTINIDLGPSQILTGDTNPISFDDLNGTPVDGSLSLDFLFSNNGFVRLFPSSSAGFDALMSLQTNGSGLMGFLQGTGYIIDAHGNAIPGFGITGSASGSGLLAIGLFPLLMDQDGTPNDQLPRPLDFYGVHFDFTFPSNPSNVVIGGQFLLAGNGDPYGIGPFPAPDTGGTLALLGITLAGLVAIPRRRFSKITNS